jgi:hypothetical protein
MAPPRRAATSLMAEASPRSASLTAGQHGGSQRGHHQAQRDTPEDHTGQDRLGIAPGAGLGEPQEGQGEGDHAGGHEPARADPPQHGPTGRGKRDEDHGGRDKRGTRLRGRVPQGELAPQDEQVGRRVLGSVE